MSYKADFYQRLIIFFTFAQHQINQKQIKQAVETVHRASCFLNQTKVIQYQINALHKKKKKRQLNHNRPQVFSVNEQLRLFSKHIEIKIQQIKGDPEVSLCRVSSNPIFRIFT